MEQTHSTISEFFTDFTPSSQAWAEVNCKLIEALHHQESQTAILSNFSQCSSHSQWTENEVMAQSDSSSGSSQRIRREASDNNYQKNICSYVSKKIVQHLISPKSQKLVRRLCEKAGCSYQQALSYYSQRSREIFGINHLGLMMTPENESQVSLKKMFCAFLNWFLRNKYMCYMLRFGKMEEKEKYIEFKNKYMLYIAQLEERFFPDL